MNGQQIEKQRLSEAPLTIRYCEKRLAKMQDKSVGCDTLSPAPYSGSRPVFHTENLAKFDGRPAPFSVFISFLLLPFPMVRYRYQIRAMNKAWRRFCEYGEER